MRTIVLVLLGGLLLPAIVTMPATNAQVGCYDSDGDGVPDECTVPAPPCDPNAASVDCLDSTCLTDTVCVVKPGCAGSVAADAAPDILKEWIPAPQRCCNLSVSSSPQATQWTFTGPGTSFGVTGYNQPSVAVSDSGWTPIGGAQPVWKEPKANSVATDYPFGQPVYFTAEFISCSTVSVPVKLFMNADNVFGFYFNNNPTPNYQCTSGTCYNSIHTVTVNALPYPWVNTLRFAVHNTGGPAMVQYRADF